MALIFIVFIFLPVFANGAQRLSILTVNPHLKPVHDGIPPRHGSDPSHLPPMPVEDAKHRGAAVARVRPPKPHVLVLAPTANVGLAAQTDLHTCSSRGGRVCLDGEEADCTMERDCDRD